MTWTWASWLWLAWLGLFFLPLELYAAGKTKGTPDTFSEFVWWAFGVKRRRHVLGLKDCLECPGCVPVRWIRARRLILAGFMLSLSGHFIFGWSPAGVIVFGIGVAAVLTYAVAYERKA